MVQLHAETHWNTMFDCHTTYDASVINEIQQHNNNNSLGEIPNRKEI
jgi:mRNA-degrading endonuclease YafQ of YafQ-DinJ toxin-antitoxin module